MKVLRHFLACVFCEKEYAFSEELVICPKCFGMLLDVAWGRLEDGNNVMPVVLARPKNHPKINFKEFFEESELKFKKGELR